MNRRKFLTGATALFCSPAIVRADSLMKIWTPPQGIIRVSYPSNEPWIYVSEEWLWRSAGRIHFGDEFKWVTNEN